MPTYVYMSTNTQANVSLKLYNTGPDDSFWNQFKDVESSVPRSVVNKRVMTVDRDPGIGDHTTIAELRLYIDGQFIVAMAVMLTVGDAPVPIKSEIWWSWRTATPATGRYVTDHDPHITTIEIGGWVYTFSIQGKGTAGFDDIYISLLSSLNKTRWMEALAARIGITPLNEIRIPGSHDSGTSSITSSSPWAPDSEWWHSFAPSLVAAWARTQSKPVAEQLLDGIRYFDFRVAPSAGGSGYALVHALQGDDIQSSLQAVHDFLTSHLKEIIILDLNHFYEMQPSDHDKLVKMIQTTLGGYLAAPTRGVRVTPNTLWGTSERIIVAYADDTTVAKYPNLLWYRQNASNSVISSPYPDTNNINTLHDFLKNTLTNRTLLKFFILQAIMTPGTAQVLWPGHSLQAWARDTINPQVADWILKEWSLGRPNIVMCDFYEESDIVGKVINLNL